MCAYRAKYCCPKCKEPLLPSHVAASEVPDSTGSYDCVRCRASYPIVAGIVDFRVYADPYIDLAADRAKGLHLAAQAERMTFSELVAYYYSITPEVPPDLAKYYLNHHLAGTTRGAGVLNRLAAINSSRLSSEDIVLDLGCGTGGLLAAAASSGARLVGVDIAFRWLVVAQKRLRELGLKNVELVCACADFLPFDDGTASVIILENLIEHVRDQVGLFSEIARVRKANSVVSARTVNRFALGPEPHVGVWGVGLLPRAWMNRYVKAIKGIPYEHIYLQSRRELVNSIQASGQTDLKVVSPQLSPQDYSHHPPLRKLMFSSYASVSHMPILGPLLQRMGPYLEVVSTTKSARRTQPRQAALSTP